MNVDLVGKGSTRSIRYTVMMLAGRFDSGDQNVGPQKSWKWKRGKNWKNRKKVVFGHRFYADPLYLRLFFDFFGFFYQKRVQSWGMKQIRCELYIRLFKSLWNSSLCFSFWSPSCRGSEFTLRLSFPPRIAILSEPRFRGPERGGPPARPGPKLRFLKSLSGTFTNPGLGWSLGRPATQRSLHQWRGQGKTKNAEKMKVSIRYKNYYKFKLNYSNIIKYKISSLALHTTGLRV